MFWIKRKPLVSRRVKRAIVAAVGMAITAVCLGIGASAVIVAAFMWAVM